MLRGGLVSEDELLESSKAIQVPTRVLVHGTDQHNEQLLGCYCSLCRSVPCTNTIVELLYFQSDSPLRSNLTSLVEEELPLGVEFLIIDGLDRCSRVDGEM